MMRMTSLEPRSLAGARRQRGLAMVEFAIGAPLLLLLLLGIGEFGRLLSQYNQLLQGSRDAARYVASHAMNATLGQIQLTTALQDTAKNLLVYSSPTAGSTPIVPGLGAGQVQVSAVGSEHIQVSVTYSFQPVVGNVLLPGIFGKGAALNIPLTATTVMRAL